MKNNKIVENTIYLYSRQIVILFSNFLIVRINLKAMGIIDYGIYNAVAGISSMLSFLSSSMAVASQRFFSYELGKNNYEKLKKIYSISIEIYIIVSFIVILFSETIGLWVLNNKLTIPIDRRMSSNLIYQLSLLSFIFTLLTTPYIAIIISHEDMKSYATISIVEMLLKIISAVLLYTIRFDKLILYGIMIMLSSIILYSIYYIICKRKYSECHFKFEKDLTLFKTIGNFAGWNLFGALSDMFKNQGINILLNIYFGPKINAARAIAFQINSAVMGFSTNFVTAIRPPIVKLYANNKKKQMINLVYRSSRMTFYLMLVFVIPISIEMPTLIKIWLSKIPEYVIVFARIILIDSAINSLSFSLMAAAQATGKIKLYQALVGGTLILYLPIAYVFLKLGISAESVLALGIFITIIATIVRIAIVRRILPIFRIYEYVKIVLLPSLLVCATSYILPIIIALNNKENIFRLLITVLLSEIALVICIYLIGISKPERRYINNMIESKIKRREKI